MIFTFNPFYIPAGLEKNCPLIGIKFLHCTIRSSNLRLIIPSTHRITTVNSLAENPSTVTTRICFINVVFAIVGDSDA